MTVQAMKAGAVEFLPKPFAVRDEYASLSRREREVMIRVVAGRLNKQVASELGMRSR